MKPPFWRSSLSIAVVYHSFPHYRAGIIRAMLNSGNNFRFFGDIAEAEGIKNFDFSSHAQFTKIKNFRIGRILFQPYLLNPQFFLQHTHFVFLANPNFVSTWISAIVCRLMGKQVIFWGHGFLDSSPSFRNQVRKIFFSIANSFFCYGYRCRNIAGSLGLSPSKFYVGLNSLDYSHQISLRCPVTGDYNASPDTQIIRIVCVSRITKLCKYELLIQAAFELRKRYGISAVITFIGDGPEAGGVKKLSKIMGVECIFLGAQYDERTISQVIQKSDVAVSPGKVGLTAMHCMMYGTPVISHSNPNTQMPEFEAIIPGVNGWLFDENDPFSLAEALLSSKETTLSRHELRSNCYRTIDNFYNPQYQLNRLLEAINGLAHEQAPSFSDRYYADTN